MRFTGMVCRSGKEASGWYRFSGERLLLSLSVMPGGRRTVVVGRYGETLKIRIAAPAEDDKANTALIEFLSRSFHLPPSQIRIRTGRHTRRKVVELDAPGPAAQRLLTAWEQQ
jgi:uncharacterized protein (TIGR00251 family)